MKQRYKSILLFGFLALFLSSFAHAKTNYDSRETGWHKGAYFLGGLGAMNIQKDVNNEDIGPDYPLAYSLVGGWNFLDFLAAELDARYTTAKINGSREHAGNLDLNVKYSWITDVLTEREDFRLLPYVKLGGGESAAAIPANSAGNARFGIWSPNIDFGIGLEALINQYLYIGLDFTTTIVFFSQKLDSNGDVVLNGDVEFQPAGFAYVGVHF